MDLTNLSSLVDRAYFSISERWVSCIRMQTHQDDAGLREICDTYGGYLGQSNAGVFYYSLMGAACADLLKEARAGLVTNAAAADIMLEFDEYMASRPKRKPFSRLSDQEYAERMEIRNRLLKANGKSGYDVEKLVRDRSAKIREEAAVRQLRRELRKKEGFEGDPKPEKKPRERKKKEVVAPIARWSEEEVTRMLKEVFSGEQWRYTELMLRVGKVFGLGHSYSKQIIRASMEKGYIMRFGPARASTTKYGYNLVREMVKEPSAESCQA